MQIIFMGLFVVLVMLSDQYVKTWVLSNIPLHGEIEAIPGLFHLTYVQNTGAAFSALQGMQWLFVLIFVIFAAFVVWEISTCQFGLTTFERWCLIAVFAGSFSNTMDRLYYGYVIDMIELEFMRFPVFNVADCFITCGCFLLIVHLIFFNRNFWKDAKSK